MRRQGWFAGALTALALGVLAPVAQAGTPPTVSFDSVSDVGSTVATFNGRINGHQDVGTLEWQYQWCKVSECGNPAAVHETTWDYAPDPLALETDQRVSATARGLAPATAYRAWLRARNDSQYNTPVVSAPREFTTQTPAPNVATSVRTDPASGVGEATANLNGALVPGSTGGSAATQWFFEWGEGSTLDRTTPAVTVPAGTDAVPVSAPLSGLKAVTSYAFRLVAVRNGARTVGATQSFKTLTGFNCAAGTTFGTAVVGRLQLTGCLRDSSTSTRRVAVGNARLNGLTLTAAGGTEVYIDRSAREVGTTGRYTLSAGSARNLWTGTLKETGVEFDGDGPLMSLGADRSVKLVGLPLAGEFSFTPKADGSGRLGLLVGMPAALGGVTGETVAAVDPAGTLVLDKLAVDVGSAKIRTFEVGDLHFLYDRGEDRWEGGASIVIPFQGRIRVSVTIAVVGGRFSEFTGNVGDLNRHIADGVFLQDIGVGFGLDPLKLAGSVGLTAGPRVAGISALGVGGGWEFRDAYSTYDSTTRISSSYPANLKLTGTVTVFSLPLAEMYASWYFWNTPWIELGGKVGVDFRSGSTSIASVEASVNGMLKGTTFRADGSAVGKVAGYTLASGYAMLTNKGVSACGSVFGQGAGAYMTWSNWSGGVYWSCDYGSLTAHITAAAAQAGTGTVHLPPNARHAQIRFVGTDAPPEVTLTGPDGRTIGMPPAGQLMGGEQDRYLVVRDPGTHSTYVQLTDTGSGTWKWAGSAVKSVQTARWLGEPKVRASVVRHGRRAVLRWHVKTVPGQVVTFLEAGDGVPPRVIARTSSAKGAKRFTPAEVPTTRHRIVATVEQNGRPRRTLDVTTFRAAEPRKVGKPRKLTATRRGKRLLVRFELTGPARRAEVLVRYPDGRRELRFPKGARLTLKGAAARAGRVTVRAIGPDGKRGPAATAKVRKRG